MQKKTLIKIKQVHSACGRPPVQRKTVRALGLTRHQQECLIVDTPAARGMIEKVKHLVAVIEEGISPSEP